MSRVFDGAADLGRRQLDVVRLQVATLKAIGLPPDDVRLDRGLEFLRGQARRDHDGLWFSIFATDVWPTAFALRALLASGSARSAEDVSRAVTWLVNAQIATDRHGDAGTWSFQSGNQTMPDSDDVGVVLAPLGMALDLSQAPPLDPAVAAPIRPAGRSRRSGSR